MLFPFLGALIIRQRGEMAGKKLVRNWSNQRTATCHKHAFLHHDSTIDFTFFFMSLAEPVSCGSATPELSDFESRGDLIDNRRTRL
jgi:hypothetical protein